MPVIFIDCKYFDHTEDTNKYKCKDRTDLVLTGNEWGKVPISCPDCPIKREACSQMIDVKPGSVIQVLGLRKRTLKKIIV